MPSSGVWKPGRNSADKKEYPIAAPVVSLRPAADVAAAARDALAAVHRHLDRCKLAANTVKAYKRQTAAYVAWLAENADHADAFSDLVGAEAAVTAWRRHLMTGEAAPATINQALAAVTLLYARAGLRITVKRARIPRPGEPDALTKTEQGRVERAAARRGVRDRAIAATLLYAGARAGECGRLDAGDVTLTARTGHIRLHGKGDEVRTVPLPPACREHLAAWLDERGTHDGPLWTGQRGRLTISGITQVVLAVGEDAGIPGLRPHRLRHLRHPVAKAAPTPPKSRHFSARPPSKPPPATSAPATPNKPPSSTASSGDQQGPPTSERWMTVTPSPQAR